MSPARARQAGASPGTGQYVVYGGEFPRVDGTGRQGLVRFAVADLAPDEVGPDASDALTPVATAAGAGSAKLTWTATSDPDDENLTYQVFRDGEAATGTYTATLTVTDDKGATSTMAIPVSVVAGRDRGRHRAWWRSAGNGQLRPPARVTEGGVAPSSGYCV